MFVHLRLFKHGAHFPYRPGSSIPQVAWMVLNGDAPMPCTAAQTRPSLEWKAAAQATCRGPGQCGVTLASWTPHFAPWGVLPDSVALLCLPPSLSRGVSQLLRTCSASLLCGIHTKPLPLTAMSHLVMVEGAARDPLSITGAQPLPGKGKDGGPPRNSIYQAPLSCQRLQGSGASREPY